MSLFSRVSAYPLTRLTRVCVALCAAVSAQAMDLGTNFHYYNGYGYDFWMGDSPFVASPGFGAGKNPSNLNPWKPEAITDGQVYDGPMRTMDWGVTNHSGVSSWWDRKLPTNGTQTAPYQGSGSASTNVGMAYEWMIDYCNRTDRDLWICVPHLATDDFVKNLARAVRYGTNGQTPYTSPQSNPVYPPLNSHLNVIVEYSNEVWNNTFDQHTYAAAQGLTYWPSDASWVRAFKWGGRRAAQVHLVWSAEWSGAMNRVVRVLSGQHTNTWVSDQIQIGYETIPGAQADAFATAPYFGQGLDGSSATIWTDLDNAIDTISGHAATHRAWADAHGYALYAYEGGNHTNQNGKDLNRHPNMYDRYLDYFDEMDDYFEVLCHFTHARIYNGSADMWGATDHFGESPDVAHKWAAIIDYLGGEPLLEFTNVVAWYDGNGVLKSSFQLTGVLTGDEVDIEMCPTGTGAYETVVTEWAAPWDNPWIDVYDDGMVAGQRYDFRIWPAGGVVSTPPPSGGGGSGTPDLTFSNVSVWNGQASIHFVGVPAGASVSIERSAAGANVWTVIDSAYIAGWADPWYQDTTVGSSGSYDYRLTFN